MMRLIAIFTLLASLSAPAQIIESSNRMDWVPDLTVGVIGGIPSRTGTVIDVTQSPYNADNTGATSASAAIQSAITAASSNDVVYLPAGTYLCTNGISIDKSGVLLRGAGTNTIIVGHIIGGHSSSGSESFNITSGATMGSTNIVVPNFTNAFGDTIAAGDVFQISQIENDTNDIFQFISVAGYNRTMAHVIHVSGRSGSNIFLSLPLPRDFTNQGQIKSLNLTGISSLRFKEGVGFESFSLVSTNNGASTTATALLNLSSLRNFWVTNVTIRLPNNYCLSVSASVNGKVSVNTFAEATSGGTSRSGITSSTISGVIIEDNIFRDLTAGFQCQGGSFSGNVLFANFFTNISDKPILLHNTHPFYNLWEANVAAFIQPDGYFGSQSHDTVLRNRFTSTLGLKRFVTYWQIVGNVLGDTNYSFVYEREESGFTTPYPIFTWGYPHIGNVDYDGSSPPISWNFPGNYVTSFSTGNPITNGVFTFTNTYGPTNTIWLSMGEGTLTNVPAPDGINYPIRFQDPVNTNKYWPDDGTVVLSASAGTSSNLVLNTSLTFSNGWRLFIAGQNAYNQRQATNKFTHNVTGNLVYTNASGTLVWSESNTNRVIPISLLYTNGAPAWWGTNRWPAIDPESATPTMPIPAQLRFSGISSDGGGGGAQAAGSINTLNVGTLRVGP